MNRGFVRQARVEFLAGLHPLRSNLVIIVHQHPAEVRVFMDGAASGFHVGPQRGSDDAGVPDDIGFAVQDPDRQAVPGEAAVALGVVPPHGFEHPAVEFMVAVDRQVGLSVSGPDAQEEVRVVGGGTAVPADQRAGCSPSMALIPSISRSSRVAGMGLDIIGCPCLVFRVDRRAICRMIRVGASSAVPRRRKRAGAGDARVGRRGDGRRSDG